MGSFMPGRSAKFDSGPVTSQHLGTGDFFFVRYRGGECLFWRIIPVSKWLVTPFRSHEKAIWKGNNPILIGDLQAHGY